MPSPRNRVVSRIKEILIPALNSLGLELVEVEYRPENRGWVLRIYIEREDGVTLEDCQRVSDEVGDLLDVEDVIDHHYRLEVSSPGFDRPLVNEKDFMRFVGQRAQITTDEPISNQRNFQGRILRVLDHKIQIEGYEGNRIEIPYGSVVKARIVPEFSGKGKVRNS